MAGFLATVLMWLAEKRNRSALDDAKKVVAAIEEAEAIPQEQRLFGGRGEQPRSLPHGSLIDVAAALISAFLLYATGYLSCSKGSL